MNVDALPVARQPFERVGGGAVRTRSTNHAPSDSVCLRCKANPATGIASIYHGFCKHCIRAARAEAARVSPATRGRMAIAVAWLKAGSVV